MSVALHTLRWERFADVTNDEWHLILGEPRRPTDYECACGRAVTVMNRNGHIVVDLASLVCACVGIDHPHSHVDPYPSREDCGSSPLCKACAVGAWAAVRQLGSVP